MVQLKTTQLRTTVLYTTSIYTHLWDVAHVTISWRDKVLNFLNKSDGWTPCQYRKNKTITANTAVCPFMASDKTIGVYHFKSVYTAVCTCTPFS